MANEEKLLIEAEKGSTRAWAPLVSLGNPFIAVTLIGGFVLWAHLGSHLPVFRSHVSFEPGWKVFRAAYSVDDFGADGHFVRVVER